MSNYWSTLTDFGASAVTTAIANNSKVNIAKVVLGDGVLTDVATDKSRTAIKNKVWESTTAPSVTINPDNNQQILVECSVPSNVGGWTVREVGLLDNNAKLIAIAKVADFEKPTVSQGQSTEYTIKLIVTVSNTSVVSLTVDASVVTASQQFVTEKMKIKADADLGNVLVENFRKLYDKLGISFKQKVPTRIFTQTSGKFFVRNADGSLPSGIDVNKVWSLAEQKTANGGDMPSGKNHIELPVGLNLFHVAGAGGGGAGAHDAVGSSGGTTRLSNYASAGGGGGGSSRGRRQNAAQHAGNGRGGAGGANGTDGSGQHSGGIGSNGDLKIITIDLNAGQVIDYTIGAGGAAGIYPGHYYGASGANGWIEVEYAS